MSSSESRAETIFFAAMERASPEERALYLREACAGDEGLRRRVERLLSAQPHIGEFLESPPTSDFAGEDLSPLAGAAVAAVALDPGPGALIGPYKLLQQIGEGGMAVVFLAEQTHPIQRKVALKLIKPGLDSRQVIARFEAERQALALMDHPNIARVLDAGATGAGRPYFVMELVKGVPITRYCDEQRLTPPQRLALFVQVCAAVQHAHQKGVIHRDIKPSNVLVALYDGQPVPKVIDFGIAKATARPLVERTMFTGFGDIIGTLEYMSPEQAETNQLDVDTRSDIYSLGVLLYELLTGTTPLEHQRVKQSALLEMLRVIREEEPPKPSTRLGTTEHLPSISANRGLDPRKLSGLMRGELDWIVMKALEKDRNRRYDTVIGLASDVRRYLGGEAVAAGPPSAIYRFRKFARRNKPAIALAALVALAVMLGISGLLINNRMVRRERDQKDAALDRALREKARADLNLTRARMAVKDYLTAAAGNPLLREADFHDLRRSLLESAIPFYQEFVSQQTDDPELEVERAQAYIDLALVWEELGNLDKALSAYGEHRAIFERLVATHSKPAYRHALAIGYRNLANVLDALNQYEPAQAELRRAVLMMESLVSEYPTEAPYRRELAGELSNLSVQLRRLGQLDEALSLQERAVTLREQLVAETQSSPEYREGLAQSASNLCALYLNLGRHADALTAIRRAADLCRTLAEEHPASAVYREMWGSTLDNQSVVLCELGRREEGLAVLQEALAVNEKLAADFRSVPRYRHNLATTLTNEAILMAELGRLDEGLAACSQSVELLTRLLADHPNVPEYQQMLALTYLHEGELHRRLNQNEAALSALRHAVEFQEKLVAENPAVPRLREDLAAGYGGLGENLALLGRYDEAAAEFQRALPLREELARPSPTLPGYAVQLAGLYVSIASLNVDRGSPQASIEWFDKALARLSTVLADEPRLALGRRYACHAHAGRATALQALGRHEEAAKDLEQAVALDDGESRLPLRVARATNLAHLRRHAEAAAEADAIAQTPDPSALLLVEAAAVYAICAGHTRDDAERFEQYAARAAVLLREAIQKDKTSIESAAGNNAFDALRTRADFQQLMQDPSQRSAPTSSPMP